MKHLILVAVSILLFSNLCIAQGNADSTKKHSFAVTGGYGKAHKKDTIKDRKRFSFGVMDGYGIPLGGLRSTDMSKYPISGFYGRQDTTHLAGCGQYGFHYEYYVAYRVYKRLSIMVSVGGNDIGYNAQTLNSQFTSLPIFKPNTVAVTVGDNYNVGQYLAGPNLDLKAGKKMRIELRAMCGAITTNYPSLSYIDMGANQESEIYTFSQSSGFAYDVGAGLKFITAEGYIGFHLNVNYVGSVITFPGYSVAYFTPPDPADPAKSNLFLYAQNFNYPKVLNVGLLQVTLGISGEL
jgi:hypothetical protein